MLHVTSWGWTWRYMKRMNINPYSNAPAYISLAFNTPNSPLAEFNFKRRAQIISSADCNTMMTIHDDEYTSISANKTMNLDEDTYPMYKLESCHSYSLSGYTAATPRTKTRTTFAEEQEIYSHLSSYTFPKGWFQCASCPPSPPLRNVSPASKTSANNDLVNGGECTLPQRRSLHRRSSAVSISTSESRFSSCCSGSIFDRAGTPGRSSAGCNSGSETPRTPTSCSKFPYTLDGLIDLDAVMERGDEQLIGQSTGGYSHGSWALAACEVVYEIESIDEADEWDPEDNGCSEDKLADCVEDGDLYGVSDDGSIGESDKGEDEGDYVDLVNFLLESRSERAMGVDGEYNPCDYVRNGLKQL